MKHCLQYKQSLTLHSTPKCLILFQNTQELPLISNFIWLTNWLLTWKLITKFILKLHTIHYIVPIILVHKYLSIDLNMHFIKYLCFVGTKSSYRRIIPILSDTTLKMGLKIWYYWHVYKINIYSTFFRWLLLNKVLTLFNKLNE